MKKAVLDAEEKDILESYERVSGNLLRIRRQRLGSCKNTQGIHYKKTGG